MTTNRRHRSPGTPAYFLSRPAAVWQDALQRRPRPVAGR
jgi:hypothetical protein